jgi:hypothetical protein
MAGTTRRAYTSTSRGTRKKQYEIKKAYQDDQRSNAGSGGKRRSGATYGIGKNDNKYVTGWFTTRQGLVSILAVPTKNTGDVASKKYGTIYRNWMAIIKYHGSGIEKKVSCLFDPSGTNNVLITDENIGIVPKGGADRRGWCGFFTKRK